MVQDDLQYHPQRDLKSTINKKYILIVSLYSVAVYIALLVKTTGHTM